MWTFFFASDIAEAAFPYPEEPAELHTQDGASASASYEASSGESKKYVALHQHFLAALKDVDFERATLVTLLHIAFGCASFLD